MRIAELSVRRPVFATVLSMMLVIFGLVSLQRLSVREYPDIDRPVVSITTAYRGASSAVIGEDTASILLEAANGASVSIEGALMAAGFSPRAGDRLEIVNFVGGG